LNGKRLLKRRHEPPGGARLQLVGANLDQLHVTHRELRPVRVNQPLIFVVDPAFCQLAIAHAVPEQPLDLDRLAAAFEALDRDDQAKVRAGQHVANRHQAPARLVAHLLQDGQAGRLAAMRAGKRAATEVVKHDLIVIAVACIPLQKLEQQGAGGLRRAMPPCVQAQ